MEGTAVGPVALICLGTYLGYLTLTGRVAALVSFLTSAPAATSTPAATATVTPSSDATSANVSVPSSAYGVGNAGSTNDITVGPLVGVGGG